MFTQVYSKIRDLLDENNNAYLILGGDLNNASNNMIDRSPDKTQQNSHFKAIHYLSEKLLETDACFVFFSNFEFNLEVILNLALGKHFFSDCFLS